MGRKVLNSMIKVKDRCTLIDEMTSLMSGNHLCTMGPPPYLYVKRYLANLGA